MRQNGYFKPYFVYEAGALRLHGSPVRMSTNHVMVDFEKDHPILARSQILTWAAILRGRRDYKRRTHEVEDPTYHILDAMKTFLLERGSKLVVGSIDSYPGMAEKMAGMEIAYLDLGNGFRYESHGNHWTPEGHDFAAASIMAFLDREVPHLPR